jgi:hypothetical protein
MAFEQSIGRPEFIEDLLVGQHHGDQRLGWLQSPFNRRSHSSCPGA